VGVGVMMSFIFSFILTEDGLELEVGWEEDGDSAWDAWDGEERVGVLGLFVGVVVEVGAGFVGIQAIPAGTNAPTLALPF
jgi:hypothetical protein